MKCTLFMAKGVDFKSVFILTVKLKVTMSLSIYVKDTLSAGEARSGKVCYYKPDNNIWKNADEFQQMQVGPFQWNLRANLQVTRRFPQRFFLGINLIKGCNQKQEGGNTLLMIPS